MVVLPWAPVEVLAFMLQSIQVQAAHYSHLSYCMYVGTYRDCVMGVWSSICREFNYLRVAASCQFKDSFLQNFIKNEVSLEVPYPNLLLKKINRYDSIQ